MNFRNSNVRLPHDYAYKDFKPRAMVKPSVPFGPRQKSKKERIESFAMWVVAKNNTNFSKTMVNRIWQVMYGRGLFEPLDDLIPETVITNKRLLTYLTKLFIEMKYDVKGFVSILAKTQLFRQEVKDKLPNVTKVANFQGPYHRRLSAEQIWDSFVYLLRGYEGDFHPYLSRVQAQNKTSRELFYRIQNLGPKEFGKKMAELQQRTKPLDLKIAWLRKKIRDMAGAERTQANAKIREHTNEANKIFTEIFGQAALENSMMMAEKKNKRKFTGPSKNAGKIVKKDKDVVKKRAKTGLDYKYDKYLMVSSKMVSPVGPGHELRVYGASDRQLVNNSNRDASVPQALIMLNGNNGPSLFWDNNEFKKTLNKQKTNADAIDCLFLSLLGRYPSARDKELSQAAIKGAGRTAGLQRIAIALTQTQRFLFVD